MMEFLKIMEMISSKMKMQDCHKLSSSWIARQILGTIRASCRMKNKKCKKDGQQKKKSFLKIMSLNLKMMCLKSKPKRMTSKQMMTTELSIRMNKNLMNKTINLKQRKFFLKNLSSKKMKCQMIKIKTNSTIQMILYSLKSKKTLVLKKEVAGITQKTMTSTICQVILKKNLSQMLKILQK